MQMPRILRSNKTNNLANKDCLAQREGGGLDVERKWSYLILNLLGKSGGNISQRAGVVNSVHPMLPRDSEMSEQSNFL